MGKTPPGDPGGGDGLATAVVEGVAELCFGREKI